jgi:hypothetical protein
MFLSHTGILRDTRGRNGIASRIGDEAASAFAWQGKSWFGGVAVCMGNFLSAGSLSFIFRSLK